MLYKNDIGITEIQKDLEDGSYSVIELIETYLERIKVIDMSSRGLNSVLEVNPDAVKIAMDLDRKIQRKEKKGLLFGVPILVKDNINTGDKMHTSAGSLSLADSNSLEDAPCIKLLRNQGAVILGKTNMTEFANYMTKGMPGGYSSRGGQVVHPYNRDDSPWGSSSGSAVSVTANLCTVSIGTDTSNSIIAPALKNGIVGYRPPSGTISQKGMIPISITLDTVGPMARTVEDAAITYAAMSGQQPYRSLMKTLKGRHVGINEYDMERLPFEEHKKLQAVIKAIKKSGATLHRLSVPPTKNVMEFMRYEFKYAINHYLKELKHPRIHNLRDIIQYNIEHPEETLNYGQYYLSEAEERTIGDLSENEYKLLLEQREMDIRHVSEKISGLDALLLPCGTNIGPYTGIPEVTIPCGTTSFGKPYGICILSLYETRLWDVAYWIEKNVGERVIPKI